MLKFIRAPFLIACLSTLLLLELLTPDAQAQSQSSVTISGEFQGSVNIPTILPDGCTATGGATITVTCTTVTPTEALIAYFDSLDTAARAGNQKILIGEHLVYYPSSANLTWPAAAYQQLSPCGVSSIANATVPAYAAGSSCGGASTGKAPAIGVFTFGVATPGAVLWPPDASKTTATTGDYGSPMNGIAVANDMCAAGVIPMLHNGPNNPNYATAFNGGSSGTQVNITNVLTAGTTENTNLKAELKLEASMLGQIKCPVLARMLGEETGNWVWYGLVQGNQGGSCASPCTTTPTQQIALFQLIHDTLIADGVTNVVWVWGTNASISGYTAGYPGANYADIVGFDCYQQSGCGSDPAVAALSPLGKPIWIEEAGCANSAPQPGSCDNSTYLNDVIAHAPFITSVIYFTQNWALSEQLNALAVMTNPKALGKGVN